MSSEITCPRCGKPTLLQNRYCEHCGVDLAFAAVIVEQSMMPAEKLPQGIPIAPEILVPRVGDTMIEQGLLTKENLQRALDYQKECAAAGKPILIGQALLDLGLTDRETLDRVITAQILKLQSALNEANQQLKQRVQERTQELQKALERLSELSRLKSNFIATISHELRTPLTHMKGYLDILMERGLGPLTPAQMDALEVIQRAEVRLEQLIEDLIQFSLASRGELSLNLQPIEIDKVIQIAIERSLSKAKKQNISLSALMIKALPRVYADEDKIGWVILQLVDNALKFTPSGGKVIVQAKREDGFVKISVVDTGIGMPQERIHEIFEPFHQLDSSTTRRYSGAGLGLALVRRILEAHGSQIKVDSVAGKGSRFEFNLPEVGSDVGLKKAKRRNAS